MEPVDTPTGGPGGGVGKLEGVGGPEGGIGGPEGDRTGGPHEGGCANGDRCPAVLEDGPCDEPFKEGTDPKIGAGFTGFPRKVGRPDMAGDPV